jgi:hypothetical protein
MDKCLFCGSPVVENGVFKIGDEPQPEWVKCQCGCFFIDGKIQGARTIPCYEAELRVVIEQRDIVTRALEILVAFGEKPMAEAMKEFGIDYDSTWTPTHETMNFLCAIAEAESEESR